MNKLVATTLEGKFHVFDVRTQNPTKGFAQVLNLIILKSKCEIDTATVVLGKFS